MAIDWDRDGWGQPPHNIHVGTTTDDAHTASEKRAEDSRG
jgi:hypothetical protein